MVDSITNKNALLSSVFERMEGAQGRIRF